MAGPEHSAASEEATLAAPPPASEAISSDDVTLAAPEGEDRTPAEIAASRAERVARLLRGDAGPTRLGHYVLLDKLGEGGMGVVFAAYDEKLDRKVAIKLLHAESRTDAHVRLVREAQAMARLSHPNVTQIYEIGELDELTFIVMEFIDGLTLRAWRRQRSRSHAELLAVFTAAGRGLAAAHDKGLVHRDFKPDNVMIRRDGRVVVMDFGLAREGGPLTRGSREAVLPEAGESEVGETTSELSVDLTATGALMGTPAYMAPEQFKGEATDAKTDQFSFCVALWEALYGERPFSAPTLAGLSLAVTHGERHTPTNTEVPSWLPRVLERGLAVEPSERWPSMDALLAALAADPTGRRRWFFAGFTALALLVAGFVGARVHEQRSEARTRAACAHEARGIESAWSEELREPLAARFAAAGAEQAWTHASAWMDAYAQAWSTLRERSCVEARVEHSLGEAERERIASCLDEGRSAAEALVEVWRSSEDRVLIQAATAAAGLPPVGLCANEAWLAHRVPPPTEGEAREQVASLRAQLERAEALRLVGEYEPALTEARAVLEQAEALAWAPLEAEARLAVGRVEIELGHYEDARRELEQASLDATGSAHDLVVLRAAISLASVVGYSLAKPEQGRYWGRLGFELLERMGLEGTIHEAALHSSVGDLRWAAGEYETSMESYREARELYEQALGPEHPELAHQLNNIGYLYKEQGNYPEALDYFRRALELSEAALGPEHPRVGEALTFIGDGLRHTGDLEGALAAQRRAIAVFEAALGPNHPQVADALNNLGNTLSELGREDEALSAYQRALAIDEAAHGPEHVAVGTSLNNLALWYARRDDYDEALKHFRRALELWTANYGAEHQYVAICHNNMGATLLRQGNAREALAELEDARQIFAATLGPEHPHVARSLTLIGEAHAALGELDEAREAFEAALAILERSSLKTGLTDVHFGLAKVLAESGELTEAVALAELARAELTETGLEKNKLEAIEAWLAERR
jgi:tetratricopeptide (TPR) repeat protein/predicted Ser/Thr protein kinase